MTPVAACSLICRTLPITDPHEAGIPHGMPMRSPPLGRGRAVLEPGAGEAQKISFVAALHPRVYT
jgi:hypothetical protein